MDVERLPLFEIERQQETLLARQLDHLWQHSPFYRKKLLSAGLARRDLASLADLDRVPFTTKDELRRSMDAAPPLGEHAAVPADRIKQVHASTGTTGRPSYVGLTERDVEVWAEVVKRTFVAHGVGNGDVVMQVLGMSRCWVGGLPMVQGLAALGACVIPAGAEPGTAWILHAIRDLRPTTLVATPNFALYLGQQSLEVLGVPAADLGVKRIFVGGEPGGGIPSLRDAADALWGAEMREAMGGTDFAPVFWADCETRTGMHLVAPDYVYAQIVSLDDQGPLPFEVGVTGELVYTHLDRDASPLLRFRHGDVVTVTGLECECGRTQPKIRCVGRTDDMMIVKGVNFYPTAIQDIILSLRPMASGAVRVLREAGTYVTAGPVRMKVERGPEADPSLDTVLSDEVEKRVADLCRVRVDVQVVEFGTYPPPGREKVRLVEIVGQGE